MFIVDSKLGRTFLLFFPEAVLREWKSWIFGLCWGGNILGLNFTWAFKLQRICYLGWIWKGEVEMLDSVRCLLSCTSGVGVQCNNGENQAHVYLNVYDLTPANKYLYWFGLGIFHSGIEGTCFFFYYIYVILVFMLFIILQDWSLLFPWKKLTSATYPSNFLHFFKILWNYRMK